MSYVFHFFLLPAGITLLNFSTLLSFVKICFTDVNRNFTIKMHNSQNVSCRFIFNISRIVLNFRRLTRSQTQKQAVGHEGRGNKPYVRRNLNTKLILSFINPLD